MKIKKLVKSKIINEADENVNDGIVELDKASNNDIAAELQAVANDTNTNITKKDVSQEVKEINKVNYEDEFKNLVIIAEKNKSKKYEGLKEILFESLETALDQKEAGIQADYPNILVYGQAGVGKTSIVSQFCSEHGIKLIKLKASTLNPEIIRGIPYPVKDDKTGEYIQIQVKDVRWRQLNHPCIIFCDEYNRANPKASDYLLGLINEHVLPTTIENEDGEYDDEIFYPNILFTVAAMNPRTQSFKQTVAALDSAQMGRFLPYELKADPIAWGKYMVDEYFYRILKNPNLSDRLRKKYQGQAEIVRWLVNNGLEFNTVKDVDDIYSAHDHLGVVYSYLSPRTLSMILAKCDGTKDSFLKHLNKADLRDGDLTKVKNCIKDYRDKDTTGNNVFNKPNSAQTKADISSTNAKKSLDDYMDLMS